MGIGEVRTSVSHVVILRISPRKGWDLHRALKRGRFEIIEEAIACTDSNRYYWSRPDMIDRRHGVPTVLCSACDSSERHPA